MTNYELLQRLDEQTHQVTDWEVEFLEGMLRRGENYQPSPKQKTVMMRMGEKYLDASTVAEWLGQERLL